MKLTKEDIETPEKREKYTVSVVGDGGTGLLTACLFAEAGFRVICVDADHHIIKPAKKGKSSLIEAQLDEAVKKHVKDKHFTATADARNAASSSDIIVFVVTPPLDERKKPDYSHIEKACREVGMGLHSESLILFQSTLGPGVTETLVKETLENASGLKAGVDFGLAYCPIHAASTQTLEDVGNTATVVGAINPQSLETACLVLGTFTKGKIVKVRNTKTAEAVKLFEQAYRDVNVALANELALLCEKIGVDFVEARNAANTQTPYHLQVPMIVGGQISEDPYLLAEEAEEINVKLRMLMLARKTNDEMLDHTLHLASDALRLCGKTLKRAKISVFGISSNPSVTEPHVSQTKRLVDILRKKGAKVQVYDPLFSHKELLKMGYPAKRTLTKTVEGADCIIIAVGHDRFKRLNLGRIKVLVKNPAAIVDMGHVVEPDKAEEKGFVYRGVGRGIWTR